MSLQSAEQHLRLVRTVYTRLHDLLEHSVHWAWAKVVWQMLHLLPVEVRTTVPVLVHIHAHWNDRNPIVGFDSAQVTQTLEQLTLTCRYHRVEAGGTLLRDLDAGQLC